MDQWDLSLQRHQFGRELIQLVPQRLASLVGKFRGGLCGRLRIAGFRVLSDGWLCADLIALGRARAAACTWERCARATLEAYRELVT